MTRRSARLVPVLMVTVLGASVATRQLPPGFVDPAPVLAAAAKAIGTDNLRCVTIAGTAYAGAVGQQRESAQPSSAAAGSLAEQARTHYSRALQAQRDGNWALYGDEIKRLGEVLEKMRTR